MEIPECPPSSDSLTTRVFLPSSTLRSRSGLCVGWADQEHRTVCVLAVVHLPFDLRRVSQELKMSGDVAQRPLMILGPLLCCSSSGSGGDPDSLRLQQLCSTLPVAPCLELRQPDPHSLPACTLLECGRSLAAGVDCLLVLYDQARVIAVRPPDSDGPAGGNSATASPPGLVSGSAAVESCRPLRLATLLRVIREGLGRLEALRETAEVSPDRPRWRRRRGFSAALVRRSLAAAGLVMLWAWSLLTRPLRSSLCKRISDSAAFQKGLRLTKTGRQLEVRWGQLQGLVARDRRGRLDTRPRTEELETGMRPYETLRRGNLCAYLAVDLLLGVALMAWIWHNRWPDLWAHAILSSANSTAGSLQSLLQWLMGAPAGLKLNSALAHFLGQFFLYHVYLWVGYLAAVKWVLGFVIWCMSVMACLGLSIFLALTADMVSMLTFHIYCFYVYAARIYSLQLTGLLALARLFGGKKWNVLRRRVDTCHYDVDQLFIGTLLLTVLLFLLPTTALFYAVFTLLRLAVVLLQTCLTGATDLLERLPVFSLLLWLSGGSLPTGSVTFDLLRQAGLGHSPDTLIMEVQPMGIWDLLRLAYGGSKEAGAAANPVVSLGRRLLTGQLIYPLELVSRR